MSHHRVDVESSLDWLGERLQIFARSPLDDRCFLNLVYAGLPVFRPSTGALAERQGAPGYNPYAHFAAPPKLEGEA